MAIEKEIVASNLVYQIWRGINWDSVTPGRRTNIYNEFASKVKSSAHTNSLGKFVEKLCGKMDANIKRDQQSLETIRKNDPQILQVLREETQVIILLMREKIEDKRNQGESDEDGIF